MKKLSRVARMFSNIAEDYDKMNHLITFYIDSLWRRNLVRSLRLPEKAEILDACTGTGDLALALSGMEKTSRVYAVDFSAGMLKKAKVKIKGKDPEERIKLVEGDVLSLPFPDKSFDAVTMAFGLRNIADRDGCLKEFCRVMKRNGELRILEFSPDFSGFFAPFLKFYVNSIIPYLGAAVTGSFAAYTYLSQSIARFDSPEKVAGTIRNAGFKKVSYRRLFPGITFMYKAKR